MTTFEEIVRLRNKNKVKQLSKILLGEHEGQAALAAKALGETKSEKAITCLIKALNRCNIEVKTEVVKALGEIADKRAVSPLSDARPAEVNANNWSLNDAISCSIEKIENSCAIPNEADEAIETIDHIFTKDTERKLIKQLDNDNSEVVKNAIEKLGEGKSLQAKSKIEELSKHNEAKIAISALLARYRLGDTSAINKLFSYAKRELDTDTDFSTFEYESEVRECAIETLGETGDEKTIPMLEELLSSYNKKSKVISALSCIHSPASVSVISTWLDDAYYGAEYLEVYTAILSLRSLYKNGVSQAYDALVNALNKSSDIAGEAAKTIADMGIVEAAVFERIRRLTFDPLVQRKAEYAVRTMLWNDREGILPNI